MGVAGGELPMVSVIMPAWNAMRYIHPALDSVLSQSYRDLELIIVNDGSSDGDYSALAKLDSRVKVIDGERGGVSRARNLGMSLARGRYLAFIDADDLWVPGKLQAQVEYLEAHDDVSIVFGQVARWHPDASGRYPDPVVWYPSDEALRTADPRRHGWMYLHILMGSPLGMITPMMRREVYERVGGFDVRLERAEDYEFWLRCSREFRMQGFAAVMAIYRIHPESTMHRMVLRNDLAELLAASAQRWGLRDPDGRAVSRLRFLRRLGRAHFDHGYQHYWKGDPAVAAREFAASMRHGCLAAHSVAYWLLSRYKQLRQRVVASHAR